MAIESNCNRKPRICMPTFTSFAGQAFRAGKREAQDVLASCDDVDFIHLESATGFALKERLLAPLVYRDTTGSLVSFNPGLKRVQLKQDYDLFVLVCPRWRDAWYVNAIEGWRDHCKTTVCWIDEIWVKHVPNIENWLPLLKKFDYVFVGIDGSGKALGDAIGQQCHEVFGGVDSLRFSHYPNPPERVIDVYSVGRRLDKLHRALLELAKNKDMFYVHDTIQSGDSIAPNYREHRDMYANMAKRSRFFLVAPGKVDSPEETGGQVSLGFRYFEAAASGAVMIGQAPNCASFNTMFDWPNAVIEIKPDGTDVAEQLSSLAAQPKQLLEISRRNAMESLFRHDWVYRWEQILNIVGLEVSQELHFRKNKLKKLAEMIGNSQ